MEVLTPQSNLKIETNENESETKLETSSQTPSNAQSASVYDQ